MLVRVSHPVPVRYVPRNGRHERIAFVARETEAEVPELGPDAFVPIDGMPFFLRRRGLWQDVRGLMPLRADGDGPASLAVDLAEWLAGHREHYGPSVPGCSGVMWVAAWRTPLLAIGPYDPVTGLLRPTYRPGGGEPAAGEIVEDLGDRCAVAVRAMLGDGLALVGDAILARLAPLVAVSTAPDGLTSHAFAAFPHWYDHSHASCRMMKPDMLDAARTAFGKPGIVSREATHLKGRLRGVVDVADDRAWFANAKAQDAHAALAVLARRGAPAVAALEARLRPVAALASVGLVEGLDAFDLVVEAMRVALREMPTYRYRTAMRHALETADFISGTGNIPEADGEALAGLAP